MAETGDLKAEAALEPGGSPNLFLATEQMGITPVGVLADAFGGATIAEQIAQRLQAFPPMAPLLV